jgi:hypothetical protein
MARLTTTTEYLDAAFQAMEDPAHEDEQPDVRLGDHGTIVLFTPLTPLASSWIAENVQEDAQWLGNSLACERRYAPYLVEGMTEAGLQFDGRA